MNCLFAFPDRIVSTSQANVTLSGGAWTAEFPLVNLQDSSQDRMHTAARSVDAAAASTQFVIDLGRARDIRVVSILGHNAGMDATIRLRGYSDAARTTLVHDTGLLEFWPEFYPPGNFWSGHMSEEDRGDWSPDFWHAFSANQTARYWLVEISDTLNPDGYIQFSRCILAPAWEPPINLQYGHKVGFTGGAQEEQSRGGVSYFDVLPLRRSQQFSINYLDPQVAIGTVFEMQRRLGLHGELFFVFDPADSYLAMKQRSFLATMRQLSALEYPMFNSNTAAFELQEILGAPAGGHVRRGLLDEDGNILTDENGTLITD